MTRLGDIRFPGLVIAPDGWVALILAPSELARWNARARRKYNRIGFFILDADGRGWRLRSLAWVDDAFSFKRAVAALSGATRPAVVCLDPTNAPAIPEAKLRLASALDASADVLTQFRSREEIEWEIAAARHAEDLFELIARIGRE